jgi:hypothetical protein
MTTPITHPPALHFSNSASGIYTACSSLVGDRLGVSLLTSPIILFSLFDCSATRISLSLLNSAPSASLPASAPIVFLLFSLSAAPYPVTRSNPP